MSVFVLSVEGTEGALVVRRSSGGGGDPEASAGGWDQDQTPGAGHPQVSVWKPLHVSMKVHYFSLCTGQICCGCGGKKCRRAYISSCGLRQSLFYHRQMCMFWRHGQWMGLKMGVIPTKCCVPDVCLCPLSSDVSSLVTSNRDVFLCDHRCSCPVWNQKLS